MRVSIGAIQSNHLKTKKEAARPSLRPPPPLSPQALGRTKPQLERSVVAVFIANEENSRILGIGVDELVKQGELEFLKKGPIFWVDVADKKPCIGTGGVAAWTLKARGALSGAVCAEGTRG